MHDTNKSPKQKNQVREQSIQQVSTYPLEICEEPWTMFNTKGKMVVDEEGMWLRKNIEGTPKVLTSAPFLVLVEE